MKSYVSLLLLTVLFFSPNEGRAEINNAKILGEVFEGCVKEEMADVPLGAQFEYCGCMVNGVSLTMNIEEILSLGLDIMSAGEDEKKQEKIALSNEKMKKYIVKCISKLYE